jgi:cytochrome c biogenesis protein CcmG, thiol:disulfide interchange protein DsbE
MGLRVAGWMVGGGIAGVLLGTLGWGLINPTGPSPSALIGKVVPSINIASLDGSELKVPNPQGTPMVVNFWASWCVPCKQEAPVLNAAARDYAGRVQFVGVDIQDSDSAARAYQAEVQSPYPVGPSISGSYLHWGVTAPPETFFVDAQGIVKSKIVGPVDRQRLEAHISRLAP